MLADQVDYVIGVDPHRDTHAADLLVAHGLARSHDPTLGVSRP
jgi:hypothetical protein